MGNKIGVVIVDDHPLFRDGVKGLVERTENYRCVGEAGSGGEALLQARKLVPELMTMDVSLPDMSGIEAVRQILREFPSIRILMLSMHPNLDFAAEALRAGARGYVMKEATSTRLVAAMDAIRSGEYFLDGQVSQDVAARLSCRQAGDGDAQDERYALLSPREQQVMRMVAEGIPSRQIAATLGLSTKTVENHCTNLMKKLDVHSKMELVRYAARLGVIDLEQWK
ncbi:MAG TPA: DNA-binding response regulator [Geobacter sp.]|nr:DNA-binding response regulator [Geobacter sp.]